MTNDGVSDDVSVPMGEWFEVPKGWMVAPDTRPYPGYPGVLQSIKDDSVVCWHVKSCDRKGLHPNQVRFDPDTNAPWCPDCYVKRFAKPMSD